MNNAALEGGFTAPPQQSAQAFRSVMQAMARPGRIYDIEGAVPPAPISIAAGTTLLTLADPTTGVHLTESFDKKKVRDWLTFHTGAPLVSATEAEFALGYWDELDTQAYQLGTAEYPDRSATLIVEMPELSQAGATLRGPGIETEAHLNLPEIALFKANRALFPLGLDFIFTSGARVAALPRSTQVS